MNPTLKYHRQDYLNGAVSHDTYYNQWVTDDVTRLVARRIGVEKLKASKEKNFSDICPLGVWDSLASHLPISRDSLVGSGEWRSPSFCICVLKAAARKLIS